MVIIWSVVIGFAFGWASVGPTGSPPKPKVSTQKIAHEWTRADSLSFTLDQLQAEADKQFVCLQNLWGKESGWDPRAKNPVKSQGMNAGGIPHGANTPRAYIHHLQIHNAMYSVATLGKKWVVLMNQMRRTIPNKNYRDIELIRPETLTSRMSDEAGVRLAWPDSLGAITWVQAINSDIYWRYGRGEENLHIIQERMQELGLEMINNGLSRNPNDFSRIINAYHVFS
jgi:hypothetical protein